MRYPAGHQRQRKTEGQKLEGQQPGGELRQQGMGKSAVAEFVLQRRSQRIKQTTNQRLAAVEVGNQRAGRSGSGFNNRGAVAGEDAGGVETGLAED